MQADTTNNVPEEPATGNTEGSGLDVTDPASWMEWLTSETTLTQYGIPAVKLLVVVFIGYIAAGIVRRMVTRVCTRANFDAMLSKFFGNLARYVVLAFVVVFALGIFGIQTASLAAVFAACGFAIGMALQGSLSHFAAGILLLVFRPFKTGDVVNVAGVTGKVTELDLFSTELTTPDNRKLIVPNGAIFGSTIENITHHPTRRVAVDVGTDYSADVAETRKILEKVVANVEGVHQEPAPQVFLSSLGASSVDWQLRVWTDTGDFWAVHEALTHDCKKALDEAKIGIPFPQVDVHMDPQFVEAMKG